MAFLATRPASVCGDVMSAFAYVVGEGADTPTFFAHRFFGDGHNLMSRTAGASKSTATSTLCANDSLTNVFDFVSSSTKHV